MLVLGLILSWKDVVIGPPFILLIYYFSSLINNKYNSTTQLRNYFKRGIIVRIIATILFSLIHEFYYGGDTVNYFKNGSQHIWDALFDNPSYYFELIFNNNIQKGYLYQYTNPMIWDLNSSEGLLIKISAFLGLFTFHTYVIIALLISMFCFSGLWVSFKIFQRLYPKLTKQLAIAFLFLPSLVFWSSGILKDPITLGAVCWLFWACHKIFLKREQIVKASIIGAIMFFLISSLKIYILLSFIPPAILWIFNENSSQIRNSLIRIMLKPFLLGMGVLVAIIGGSNLTEGDKEYDVNNFSERQQINAHYLSQQVQTGSAYNIGLFDGSFSSFVKVAPQAINVSLFRPYLWEARNPFMLLAAMEATFFLFLTIKLIFQTGLIRSFKLILGKPIILFCILFSLIFAFGVGANSGNFGSLVRYKIPLMPFYLAGLYIAKYESSKDKHKVKLVKKNT